MRDIDRISGVLQSGRYFKNWPKDDILELASLCTWVRYDPDTVIIHAGDPASALFLIVNGHVELSYTDGEGKDGVIDLLGDGQLVGECALAPEACYAVSIKTLDATTAIRIDGKNLITTGIAPNDNFQIIIIIQVANSWSSH